MKKETIIIGIIWILVIIYGLFIYPNPEIFPVLSGRFVSFLVPMLGVSTLLLKDDRNKII